MTNSKINFIFSTPKTTQAAESRIIREWLTPNEELAKENMIQARAYAQYCQLNDQNGMRYSVTQEDYSEAAGHTSKWQRIAVVMMPQVIEREQDDAAL